MCSDELSPTLLNCEESDPVDSDDCTGSEMSEQSSAGEHTESGAEMSDESEVRFAEGEDNGDEDDFDRERNVENDVITFVPRSEMETVPSPESESEDEESLESDSISRKPEFPVLVSDDDDEPDDTVVRSEEFGRCTICFEDIPYDPVGCLYCQQMIGCRRCVKRWYGRGRSVNVIDLGFLDGHQPDNHRQCPLCRHEWLDQMEVTSMFDLRSD
uniref:RING-type domain-containing protein n=1 Tax=Angiostrongylus cantonensis TaxID=6313 RepID=A0A158P6E9_ANGCA